MIAGAHSIIARRVPYGARASRWTASTAADVQVEDPTRGREPVAAENFVRVAWIEVAGILR